MSRNWFLLFHCTMFGAFIGLIVYIITGSQDYIWIIAATCCAIAFGIDTIIPTLSVDLFIFLIVFACAIFDNI